MIGGRDSRPAGGRQVGIELPMDSDEAAEENSRPAGKTLLYVLGRGYVTERRCAAACDTPCSV
jgi:hypothetical protein